MGIMMVPQFRFESTPWLQQHFLFFIIKSKRNHTHPLLESCQKQLTAILISGTKPAGTLGWLPSLAWAQHMNSFNWWVWTGRSRGHHRHSNGPNKLKNDIPSELKGSSLNFTKLITTKPGQGLKTAKTHQISKENPLAILYFCAILQSQHTWRNWQWRWLPWRNWQRRHILQLRFSSQRLEDLFSKSNGPKWANWLGSTINCWLTYCVHDLTMLGSCKCKSIVNEKFNNTIDSDNVPSLDVEFANVPHSSPDRMTARGYLITKELIVCSQDKARVLAARFGRMLAPAVPVPNPESAIIPAPFAMQSTPAQCSSTSSASAKQAAQRQCFKT